jgi:lipopolysaccharide/colanic/teichoic acid biosynthesis glycosyltransferase
LAKRRPVKAVLIASGAEAEQINERVNESAYGISITSHIRPNEIADDDLHDLAREIITRDKASLVILDTKSKVVKASLSKLYNFLYSDIYFTTVDALHETIFERISINRLRHEWFIENIRRTPHVAYDSLKRMMDVGVSGILYIISLPLYPFISLAIWLDDPGSIFYQQKRIGQFGKEIEITKFRSMTMSSEDKRVTKVGWFLRKTRIDELPQLYNVLEGKLSLIGPRPETPSLVNFYEKEISYYQARHLIKPGISGWAQLRHKNPPKFEAQIQATKEKLSYDLYYVKNRSLLLDIKIGLWTLRVLASRSGT